jgi:hypothetical protein
MNYKAKIDISISAIGDVLPGPLVYQSEEIGPQDGFFKMSFILPMGFTQTVDFGDMNIGPVAMVVFTDTPVLLNFGFSPPPANVPVRSIYAASYDPLAPLDYVHLVGTDLVQDAHITVIAYGKRLT